MLNLAALRQTPLARDPYDHVIVDGFLSADALHAVNHDFPKIAATGSFPLSELTYGPAFESLVDEMLGADLQEAMADRFQMRLDQYFRIVTVRGRVGSHDGGVHTDAKWKIISVLLYLNESWEDAGGRLRLLRDEDVNHTAIEIVPKWGTLLAFRRADNSWHGHLPAEGERRVLQLNWVTSQEMAEREVRRHKRSAFFKRLLRRPA
jgi:SM-20-related protein